VLAGGFDFGGVEVGVENFFLVVRRLGNDAAEGIGDKTAALELNAVFGRVLAGAGHFRDVLHDGAPIMADAVEDTDEYSVGGSKYSSRDLEG
jgi:hypothetical protein